ncbi:MAG: wax ester/triacylglycerol synthase family O-acyltransferase [Mycobacterium sp.]|nr:wax ester/triacylglycerol synthase family O-acyltransferase [Mycobacterium sp.]
MTFLNASPGVMAIDAVAIIQGTPDHDLLNTLVAERLPSTRSPRVRRVAIPGPGNDAQLFAAIAHSLARPLDPDHPSWECSVIEGLQGDRWAMLLRVSPHLVDGHSAPHLLARLCDAAGDAFAGTVARPTRGSRAHRSTGGDARGRASAVFGNVTGAVAGALRPALRTSPGAAATRRYRAALIPMGHVDGVCRKFGVTADDVALAAVTEGFRTVLLQRGEQPRADSLPTLMPDRPAMLPYLPVEHDDPVQRLRTVHRRRQAGRPARGLVRSALALPTILRGNVFNVGNVLQLLAPPAQRCLVTLATNVTGPRRRLRLLGQPVAQLLPIPATGVRAVTGVAALSYGDELVFGVTTESGAAFEVSQLTDGIESGMARLVALSDDSVLLFGKDRRRGRGSDPDSAASTTVRRLVNAGQHRPPPP